MTREEKIAMLRLAKELTGHDELSYLIETSNKLEDYLSDRPEEVYTPLSFRDFISSGVMIPHPTKDFVPFVPYEYQLDMADSFSQPQGQAIVGSRQLGIDLITNLYVLWSAMNKPNQTIMVMNTPQSQANEDLAAIYLLWAHYTGRKVHAKVVTKQTIQFDNGSKIIGKHAHSLSARGTSLTHVVFHNAKSISHSQSSELDAALQPMLATGGKMLLTSVPDEPVGYFFDKVKSGTIEVLRYPWHVHPERGEEWKNMIRNGMSERDWRSEYECEFVSR